MKDLNETKKDAYYMTHDGTPFLNELNGYKYACSNVRGNAAQVVNGTFPFPGYLKLWQLKIPKPQLSDQYDVLFIDEAQDCTPGKDAVTVTLSCWIVETHNCDHFE